MEEEGRTGGGNDGESTTIENCVGRMLDVVGRGVGIGIDPNSTPSALVAGSFGDDRATCDTGVAGAE